MAYKIANIKWLRDQGWSISSSYASGFCPTYNEIVNEIPKGSITVDVNGTCIATSKAYTNNQLVCESDINIGSDCNAYQFSTITTPLETHVSTPIAWSLYSLEQLTYTIMSSGGFLTGITVVHSADRWQYMGVFNTTTSTSDRTATIEYRNGDGTCVFTQQLVMKGETCPQYQIVPDTQVACSGGTVHFNATTDTCTCNQIGVSMTELNISADSAFTKVGVVRTNDCVPNVTYESTQPTWLSGVTSGTNNIRIKCSENTTYNSRSGSVNVKMNGNTCSTVNVTQAGKPTPQTSVYITFTGLPSNLSSGGLSMTGSTYTATFILAGPNAGTGTLSGTFSPSDSRQVMTFSGQFTSMSGGGNIVNSCDGSSTSYKYAVYTASWNAVERTLNVTFGACS